MRYVSTQQQGSRLRSKPLRSVVYSSSPCRLRRLTWR